MMGTARTKGTTGASAQKLNQPVEHGIDRDKWQCLEHTHEDEEPRHARGADDERPQQLEDVLQEHGERVGQLRVHLSEGPNQSNQNNTVEATGDSGRERSRGRCTANEALRTWSMSLEKRFNTLREQKSQQASLQTTPT